MVRSATHRRILLGTLMLFCITLSRAGAQDRKAVSTSRDGAVKLPVVDKLDIRFLPFSAKGAPRTRVRSIAQDDHGFLWLGTNSGLYRYDGYRLENYRLEPSDPASLTDDRVWTVYKDGAGTLWVGTEGGLDRLDPTQKTFTHYRHDPANDRSLSPGPAHVVHQDHDGTLWVGTAGGLDRMDPSTDGFIHYRHDPRDDATLSDSGVLALHEDRRGNLWIGTVAGLNLLEKATGRITRFRHDPADPHSLGHDFVGAIVEDRFGVLWLASSYGSGLSALNVKTGRFTRYSFRAEELPAQGPTGVAGLYVDRAGVLWLCTMDQGLLKLDPEARQFVRYSRDPAEPNTLPNDTVLSLFEDAEGVMWVGTQSGLVAVVRNPPFVNFAHRGADSASLADDMIWSVLGDRHGDLWIGTETGLHRLDRRTRRVTLYRHDPKDPHSLSFDKVSGMREDLSGALWIGTYGGGLDRLDPATGRFDHYRRDPRDPHSLDSNLVLSVFIDRKGVVWVGTEIGALNRFDRASGRFKAYRTPGWNYVYSIFEDRAGILWLGGKGGVTSFDPGTEQFTVHAHDARDPSSISHNEVWAVHEDKQGRLWVATSSGLNELDRTRGTFTSISRKDGLASNSVRAIVEDGEGDLWLATDDGLSRFRPKTRAFRNFTESDGLPGNLLNPYGLQGTWQSPTGEIVLGSTNGLTTFFPDRLTPNPYVLPVVLTELALFNKPVGRGKDSPLQKPIWATDSLTLTHEQSIFTLEFAGLSYAAPERNRYRYRLQGLESEWNEVDSGRRQATYTSLPARQYVFRVQASNKDGVWNEKGVTLAVTVLPPWWATWWFRTIMGLVFVGSIIIAYYLRISGLKEREGLLKSMVRQRTTELLAANQRAEEATAMKSMFLANMSHEIRTPMNAVIGMAYLALKTSLTGKQRDYVSKIHNAGTSLLGIINDILDFSKIEAGRLDIEAVEFRLDDVIALVTSITAQKAQDKGLEFLTDVVDRVPQNLIGDPLRLGQVISNLINNAIKFTEHGDVYLKAELLEEIGERAKLRFSVKDTGIGMTPEQAARLFQPFSQADASTTRKHGGTGLGLTISRRLVELMGGEIWLESEPGVGSTFVFTLSVAVASGAGRSRIVPEKLRAVSALVVDDNAAARDILVHALEGFCARVDAVSSGQEAIAAVKQPGAGRSYDVIFMDWRMPGMDGIQAARLIKEDPQLKTRPAIVLVTAFGREDVREEAERIQMNGFLLKPVTTSTLVDTLVNLFAEVRQDRTALAPADDRHADRLRGLRVLLAEDNEINQQIAVELLEGVGAKVEVANDGLEVVRKMLDQPEPPNYDVVLMDLQMPQMDGYQATHKIRSDPRFASFPIIAMTAHATVDERQKCLAAGMNDHVSKPIDPSSLFGALERFVVSTTNGPSIRPTEPDPTTVAQADELPDVTGLNLAEGLSRVAGNKKLYRKLLRQFSSTEADAGQRIAAALAENNRSLAERLAHSIKGVAGNLGAPLVQNAAASLEKAIASSAPAAEIEACRASFEQCLGHLIEGLGTALKGADGEQARAGDPGQLKAAVEQLSRYLADSDADAIDYFEASAPHLRILFGTHAFEHFASLVENYEFSEAHEELITIAERNHLTITN